MFRIDLGVLFVSAVQIFAFHANGQLYSDDFTFSSEGSDESCTFKNGIIGQCTALSECPSALYEFLQLRINPTTCRFEKDKPIVCCQIENELPVLIPPTEFVDSLNEPDLVYGPPPPEQEGLSDEFRSDDRTKSLTNCEDVYSLPVPIKQIPGQVYLSVIGGEVTKEGEFPHMAALGWTEGKKVHWGCGGTLISHDFVLTAAHCVIRREPPDIVRIGERNLVNPDPLVTPQDFGIADIFGHPDYKPSGLYDDIALIKLNDSATITTSVRPACLWQANDTVFTDAIATGYGLTQFGGKASNELLKVVLDIFSNDDCNVGYRSEILLHSGIIESQICAGDSTGQKDTCQGDSGGPLQVWYVVEEQLVFYVIGVTSFGTNCATTVPGVYTKVSNYLDWIESIVWP